MTRQPEIVPTADGSHTLRHPVTGETYHSVNGAIAESQHVFIRNGFDAHPADPANILEVGFGTGLNALLTLRAVEGSGRRVNYTGVELYPISIETASRLSYASDPLFMKLHEAAWDTRQKMTSGFTLAKIHGDLADTDFDDIFTETRLFPSRSRSRDGSDCVEAKYSRAAESSSDCSIFDIVYFDAFAPDSQPELWTGEVFTRLFVALAPGGILVTYSAKGDVKRALREAGFEVQRLEGAPGKRHMLRAVKP